ncbi:MAG: Ig-like domain-containing protein, partial [Planctomycetes bacterium]|nr:Ig-like domain-containing protein [Planctomycetota bacterium]
MNLYPRYGVLLAIALLLTGCSRNNIADIFPPFNKADPEQHGWSKNDNGTFVLHALEPDAVFSSDAPKLLALYPANEAKGVGLDTLVVFRFSETMAADITGIRLEKAQDSNPVAVVGTLGFAPHSANRILVFDPATDLEASTRYRIVLNGNLLSAMGETFDTGSADEVAYTFETGSADSNPGFAVIGTMTLPLDKGENVSDGASLFVFFTEAVNVS